MTDSVSGESSVSDESGSSAEVPSPDVPVSPSPAAIAVRAAAEERGHQVEILGDGHAVQVIGRFGEPTLAALELMLGTQAPLGVWADGVDGGRSAMCLWTGADLYAITLGEGGRWEQFRVAQSLNAVRDSWRSGGRARFRVPRGPLMEPIPEAVELAVSWGLPAPKTSRPAPPPPPPPAPTRPVSARPSRAAASSTRPSRAASSAASRQVPAEPTPKVCSRCFMVLPATGRCDYCA